MGPLQVNAGRMALIRPALSSPGLRLQRCGIRILLRDRHLPRGHLSPQGIRIPRFAIFP
jgi:hypothetical protein